jgi:hypothetical protein
MWQDEPLGRAVEASIGMFARAFASDAPNKRLRATISRGRGTKEN